MLERRNVGPEPRRDFARVAAVEEPDVLAQQRLKDERAQPHADALRAEAKTVVASHGRHGLDDEDAGHHQRQLRELVKVPRADRIVEDLLDDVRIGQRGGCAEQDERESEEVRRTLGPHEPTQPARHVTARTA